MATPVHDWIRPRLDALLAEAVAQGMDRLAVVAVMTDIVQGPDYNTAETPPEDAVNSPASDMAHEPVTNYEIPAIRSGWFRGGLGGGGV